MTAYTKSLMVPTHRFMAASDKTPRSLLAFQSGSKNRYSTCSLASSNALANAAPFLLDPESAPRLTPNPTVKIESSVDRMNRFSMSTLSPAAAAAATMPASSAATSRNTPLLYSRSARVVNSKLATFRWCRHLAPSTLKIPSPRRSSSTPWVIGPLP